MLKHLIRNLTMLYEDNGTDGQTKTERKCRSLDHKRGELGKTFLKGTLFQSLFLEIKGCKSRLLLLILVFMVQLLFSASFPIYKCLPCKNTGKSENSFLYWYCSDICPRKTKQESCPVGSVYINKQCKTCSEICQGPEANIGICHAFITRKLCSDDPQIFHGRSEKIDTIPCSNGSFLLNRKCKTCSQICEGTYRERGYCKLYINKGLCPEIHTKACPKGSFLLNRKCKTCTQICNGNNNDRGYCDKYIKEGLCPDHSKIIDDQTKNSSSPSTKLNIGKTEKPFLRVSWAISCLLIISIGGLIVLGYRYYGRNNEPLLRRIQSTTCFGNRRKNQTKDMPNTASNTSPSYQQVPGVQ